MRKEREDSTRQVMLNLLKTEGEMSVNDLARELGITEMAVRRHLNAMERDGLVDTVLVRQALGRPTHRYSLTPLAEEHFPKNYPALTLDLLEELGASDGEPTVERLFERRKEKLARQYEERMKEKSLAERVRELAAIQNAAGYMAEWESCGDGYRLQEYNCPISQVAYRYQQACQCELALFRQLLGATVERTECLSKGDRKCAYVIR